jgi:hypothetical protein
MGVLEHQIRGGSTQRRLDRNQPKALKVSDIMTTARKFFTKKLNPRTSSIALQPREHKRGS